MTIQNWRLEQMTFKCDLVLELTRLGHAFCTSSKWVLYIWPMFQENLFKRIRDIEQHKIEGWNKWPSSVTLTLNWNGCNMRFAHCLNQLNIWPKFKKKQLKSIENIKWKQKYYRQTDRQTRPFLQPPPALQTYTFLFITFSSSNKLKNWKAKINCIQNAERIYKFLE